MAANSTQVKVDTKDYASKVQDVRSGYPNKIYNLTAFMAAVVQSFESTLQRDIAHVIIDGDSFIVAPPKSSKGLPTIGWMLILAEWYVAYTENHTLPVEDVAIHRMQGAPGDNTFDYMVSDGFPIFRLSGSNPELLYANSGYAFLRTRGAGTGDQHWTPDEWFRGFPVGIGEDASLVDAYMESLSYVDPPRIRILNSIYEVHAADGPKLVEDLIFGGEYSAYSMMRNFNPDDEDGGAWYGRTEEDEPTNIFRLVPVVPTPVNRSGMATTSPLYISNEMGKVLPMSERSKTTISELCLAFLALPTASHGDMGASLVSSMQKALYDDDDVKSD